MSIQEQPKLINIKKEKKPKNSNSPSEGKVYRVKRGFMAFQFDQGKPVYSIGIEKNAIESHGVYHCVIGKEKREVTVTMDDIERLLGKYGRHRMIRKRNNKPIYIVPLRDVEGGELNG